MKHTLILIAASVVASISVSSTSLAAEPGVFDRDNLVAWCIVPFDGKKRGPAERAEMCAKLGLKKIAYDWRAEHVPTFEQEILEYKKRGLEFFAFWDQHDEAFRLFEKYDLRPQIWRTLGSPDAATQPGRVEAAARQMLPLVERTRKLGCKLGLYNHGGWGGEPENLIAVCRYLRQQYDAPHVGIVYNLHHGHGHVDDFAAVLAAMKPYLLCLNLNGMTRDGDRQGKKILPLGEGELDVPLLRVIHQSGYAGPIGIIGHTQDDVEQKLRDSLDGLDWILPQLNGRPAGPKPQWRTWKPTAPPGPKPDGTTGAGLRPGGVVPEYSPEYVARVLGESQSQGDPGRGLMVFASAQLACISCHKIGEHGGAIGPPLTEIAGQRPPHEIVESVLWPTRQVKPEFQSRVFVTDQGQTYHGFVLRRSETEVALKDPSRGLDREIVLPVESIELEREGGTLMPENLVAAMTDTQLRDLLRFLLGLGHSDGIPLAQINETLRHAQAHLHGPAEFPLTRAPLQPELWPSWTHHVNRDRIYDFYAKEADYFRDLQRQNVAVPPLLMEFPGLDGGQLGHWGNQNEDTWASNAWNDVVLGSVQAGIFRGGGVTVPRAVCARVGGDDELACCFNPDTLSYDMVWKGGFLSFSSVRHGFMNGVTMEGTAVPFDHRGLGPDGNKVTGDFQYLGFYRVGPRVVFSYRIGAQHYLDSPWVKNGKFTRQVAPADDHPLATRLGQGPRLWPQQFPAAITQGDASPYAVDTIAPPLPNPWRVPFFAGGVGFLPDGSALVCTMHGDVWRLTDYQYPSKAGVWRRYASGLHHCLGMIVDGDGVFVLGRDQITRLRDDNQDGEADFYECFSNAYQTSAAGHDFVCGLQRDAEGNFYTASGNQGVVRISSDGRHADVVATGFRNPDGLGLTADGVITVPCSEGNWTPATMICAFDPGESQDVPHFGYPGPKDGQVPRLPLAYLPRGVDNSAGGQQTITSDRWGPLEGQLLHFSFGTGAHFLVLRDEVNGQPQGAIVPLSGEFASGVHRGRFSPADGQLYVAGMQGWGCYTPEQGCFQRVRYTGAEVRLPVGFHLYQNGVWLKFSAPLDAGFAADARSHFAQCWNYRYGPAYGSPEFSSRHRGTRGHDHLPIQSAHVLDNGYALFLEIPDLQPVNQLHLRVGLKQDESRELFVTAHALDSKPFLDAPGLRATPREIQPHPMLADLALATRSAPNPFTKRVRDCRQVKIATGTNLTYATRSFQARPGEWIEFTLSNPDVVPHNWALVKPGTLRRVGQLANRLISDPDAFLRHYVPESTDVLCYTDVVAPQDEFTIYFQAPERPGRYPYLCTFPGHWLVMNGEMIVAP